MLTSIWRWFDRHCCKAIILATFLLFIVFGSLTVFGFTHVKHLTLPELNQSKVISQISYAHQGLLLAAETNGPQVDLRLLSDDFLKQVNFLREDPSFVELREIAPNALLSSLYETSRLTSGLMDNAATPQGRQTLIEKLRLDAPKVQEITEQLTNLEYNLTKEDVAEHATELKIYITSLGLLTFIMTAAGGTIAVMRRRNSSLRRARSKAEELSEVRTKFLSNMSHEIRTPLNGILGTLQVIDHGSLSPDNKESIDLIGRSSRSLLEIVNNILDVSKIEAGESVDSLELFDTRVLVDDVISLSAGLLKSKDIDLLVRVDESLPVLMTSDRLKLEQVLNNLLSNAIKFTESGSIVLEVRRSAPPTSGDINMDSIQFIVSDTGIGISKEDQAKLFEPFKQVDSSLSRKYKGTGLGLSIARGLVEGLGGIIKLESSPGKGTTVTVELPHAINSRPALNGGLGKDSAGDQPQIALLGEYSTIFRASLALSQLGIRVKVIRTPTEAASFLTSLPSSLCAIISDRRFGDDAIAWISQLAPVNRLYRDLPIIILSGHKTFPSRSTDLQIFEIEGRYNRSHFLEALHDAAPSLGMLTTGTTTRFKKEVVPADLIFEQTKALVVDDNAINRRVLVRLLKNAGVGHVEHVPGAIEAMKQLEKDHYDIVFMDLQMPEIDGYTAARMIREKGYKDIRIFACSAHAFESDIQRSFDEGLDGHIAKPVESDELMVLLKKSAQLAA